VGSLRSLSRNKKSLTSDKTKIETCKWCGWFVMAGSEECTCVQETNYFHNECYDAYQNSPHDLD
jgi:hypothetical protein